ncbi:GAF domain-containing protein [Paenibacillus mendelii]|uniref:GAF domain-containing protein n=1 Tax=Paenibacillus mendelii TaxID=206163 RepID=A0ABV6JI31_9BACL|nr:GAF domain-containing protein [Paenibacillus mendelii]MCQ6558345.1 GAF domain-containing protein [Paenibacillus mendelii]
MYPSAAYQGTRDENIALLLQQLQALIEDEPNPVANLANASALLAQFLDEINWVGFYMAEGDELVLGPFQGLPACVRIPFGKGVCGTAAASGQTVIVPDVHKFPGHIACDAASQSEIVLPLIKDGRLLGVLDIDSPITNRFNETDRIELERFVQALVTYLNVSSSL